MTRTVPSFPNAVCWDATRRATVLNPIALDVPLSVFRATHHPSLVQREGAASDSIVGVDETLALDEFLSGAETHVFTAAVGDTGTGKSHFIRWLYLEILQRAASDRVARHVVVIPRSAANLADVVRRILQDFNGEATARLRSEVERHRGLGEPEARQRVLDELAIAVESAASTGDNDEEEQYLRYSLPAFLRDHEIRRALTQAPEGILQRLARHVLGQRESAEPESLRWVAGDLVLAAQVIGKASAEASELAGSLLNDDSLRGHAVVVLQRAVGPAIAALLRFRTGDLKRALAEIRTQLAAQGKELVLLLEDLSITEGLDGELLEALQVRTQDSGVELCTLRSIVGLTREDYQRLRDNIKGRLTRTYVFDAPIGRGTTASEDTALALFAARYLNAVRLDAGALEDWARINATAGAPTACDGCVNLRTCHDSFGELDGYGLYPLTATALGRLYRRVVRPDGAVRPFKPRSVLKILSDVLDEAQRGFARGDFPTDALVKFFGLGSTTAELRLEIKNRLQADSDRTLRALELYAEQPAAARPSIPTGVAAAFSVRVPSWPVSGAKAGETGGGAQEDPEQVPPPPQGPQPDEFDGWLQGKALSDRDVNIWRPAIHDALSVALDWDVEKLAHLKSLFLQRSIQIEGQVTRVDEPILVVTRTPEAAITLRTLSKLPKRDDTWSLLQTARVQIEKWVKEVRHRLEVRGMPDSGVDAVGVGIELLAVGAYLRGVHSRTAVVGPLLDSCMGGEWDAKLATDRGAAWSALLRAYEKHGKHVRDIVRYAISCTKGGQAGPFLDPSSALQTLRGLKRGILPSFAYEANVRWGVFKDVGLLARDTQQYLAIALDEERRAAEAWQSDVGQQLREDSPADVIAWTGAALDAAAGAGLGDAMLRRAVSDLQGRALKGCLDAVEKAIAASDETARLVALGSLDRSLMKGLGDAVEKAATALGERELRLRARLQDAHGGKTPDELLAEIQEQLSRLDEAYAELAGEGKSDG